MSNYISAGSGDANPVFHRLLTFVGLCLDAVLVAASLVLAAKQSRITDIHTESAPHQSELNPENPDDVGPPAPKFGDKVSGCLKKFMATVGLSREPLAFRYGTTRVLQTPQPTATGEREFADELMRDTGLMLDNSTLQTYDVPQPQSPADKAGLTEIGARLAKVGDIPIPPGTSIGLLPDYFNQAAAASSQNSGTIAITFECKGEAAKPYVMLGILVLAVIALVTFLYVESTNAMEWFFFVAFPVSFLAGWLTAAGIGEDDLSWTSAALISLTGVAVVIQGLVFGRDELLLAVGSLVFASAAQIAVHTAELTGTEWQAALAGDIYPPQATILTDCMLQPEELDIVLESATSVVFLVGSDTETVQAMPELVEVAMKLRDHLGKNVRIVPDPCGEGLAGLGSALFAEFHAPADIIADIQSAKDELQAMQTQVDLVVCVGMRARRRNGKANSLARFRDAQVVAFEADDDAAIDAGWEVPTLLCLGDVRANLNKVSENMTRGLTTQGFDYTAE